MDLRKLRAIDLFKRDGQLFVRCPVDLKVLLAASAVSSARSLAAEATIRLVQSLKDYDYIPNH